MPKVTEEYLEKRKAEILAAAKEVFLKKGFEPTTMQDVVDASNMSRGGVYQYFSSTEEMFKAIRKNDLVELEQYIDRLLKKHESMWEALMEYLSSYEEIDGEGFGKVSYEYSVTSWRDEEHRKSMVQHYFTARDQLLRLLQTGVDSGEFKPIHSLEGIITFIFNVTDGLILYAIITDSEDTKIKEQLEALKIYLKTALQIKE